MDCEEQPALSPSLWTFPSLLKYLQNGDNCSGQGKGEIWGPVSLPVTFLEVCNAHMHLGTLVAWLERSLCKDFYWGICITGMSFNKTLAALATPSQHPGLGSPNQQLKEIGSQ